MKVKAQEVPSAFARQRDTIRLVLICGPDVSRCESVAAAVAATMPDGAERIELSAQQLADDPAALAGEAKALSMFGDARYLFLRLQGRETTQAAKAIERLLDDTPGGDPVILCAPGMSDKLALAKTATKRSDTLLAVCYEASPAEMRNSIADHARSLGVQIPRQLIEQLADQVSNDETLARMEIEKLALYCDASPQAPQPVDEDMLHALGAPNDEEDLGALFHAALEGDLGALGQELASPQGRNFSEHGLLRLLSLHLARLLSLRGQVDDGASPKMVVENKRNAVFWKDAPRVARQLALWPTDDLARLAERLGDLEITLKSAGANPSVLVPQELLMIARRARANSR